MRPNLREARGGRIDLAVAVLAFALPFALYAATLAPGLLNDDPGEYQLVLGALGVAHPTGYPLYTLAGHLFVRLLPFGDVAWRINLFSALAGALACMALFALMRALGATRSVALLSSLLFAVSADAWFYATIAQTYALNSLLLALALLAFARWLNGGDARSFAVLAFAAGLGTAHHSTFWLILPAIVIGVLWALVEAGGRRIQFARVGGVRGLALGVSVFFAPLVLYFYVPIRGGQLLAALPGNTLGVPHAVVSGLLTPHYLPGWMNVVTGSFYSGSTLGGADADWGSALAQFVWWLARNLPGVGLLALGVLHSRIWRQHGPVVALILSGWVFNFIVVSRGVAAFNEPAGGLYTPTLLLAVVAAGLTSASARSLRARALVTGALVLALIPAFYLASIVHGNSTFHLVGGGEWRDFKSGARSTLHDGILQDAVILGAWSQVTPLHYVQIIEGKRSDVSVLQAPLASPEGRKFANRVIDADLPLYFIEADESLFAIPLRSPPVDVQELNATFGSELRLTGFRWSTANAMDGGQGTATVLRLYLIAVRQPSADYKIFTRCTDARGMGTQESCVPDAPLGNAYWPTSLWRAGQLFEHRVVMRAKSDIEFGLYHPESLKRLSLQDGTTMVRLPWP